ncbi:capsid protein [Papio cynocephalus associated smacovirus]|uniref:Capsid protein n=1 Tax=Papio cynocephalus associated smacovirus TaxID=2213168 RepID=A0A455R3U1_9VIRU|nr:capsid protein [Papio cynocephalus associated smacovirus]BBE29377.1 capsid protein [Papio cynocephalus associated smacovirus]
MVIVKVSETYDLSTVPNKIGLIGIHTPDAPLISRNYPGLLMQCKKMRFVSCDVKMACASILPADPLQVGVEAGDIAPQDLFNPILYKAMGNVGMSQLELRLQGLDRTANDRPVSLEGCSLIESQANALPDDVDNWQVYYALLSNRHGWKTAMPQQGLVMKNLYPIVHHKLYQFGDNGYETDTNNEWRDESFINIPNGTDATASTGQRTVVQEIRNRFMIGKSERMPAFNTTCIVPEMNEDVEDTVQAVAVSGINRAPGISGYMPNDSFNGQTSMPLIPRIYVGAVIMPPAKLNRLYYRCTVSWLIEFSEIRPISEVMDWQALARFGQTVYFTDYVQASTQMANSTAIVDTTGMDIEKVM